MYLNFDNINFDNINFDPGAVTDLGLEGGRPAQVPQVLPQVPQVLPQASPGQPGDILRDTPGASMEGFDFSTLPNYNDAPGSYGGILDQPGPYYNADPEGNTASGFDQGFGRFSFGGGQTGGTYDAEGYNENGVNSGGLNRSEQAMVDDFMAQTEENGWDFENPFFDVFGGGGGPLGGSFGGGFIPGSEGGLPPLPVTPWETVGDLDGITPTRGTTGEKTEYPWSPPPAKPPSDSPFQRPDDLRVPPLERPDAESGIASLAGG